MKTTSPKSSSNLLTNLVALIAGALLLCGVTARATNYAGNGSGAWGGSIGTGTLTITDNGTNLTFTLLPNGGSIGGGNGVALFIDTGASGFADTSGFLDAHDSGHCIVSGYSGSSQSVMTFTNGFRPSYAISFSDSYTSLFKLANGGDNSLSYITGQGSNPLTFTCSAASLGLTPGTTTNIRIFGSLIGGSGYRSREAIAGDDHGTDGWNPFVQTAYSSYTFAAPPAPTYNVTFQVDMSVQIANGSFNPNNGDTVYASGTFQTNAWSGFPLQPSVANTNIYVGTYPDQNPTNTAEQFKFKYYSVANSAFSFDDDLNRVFILKSGGQTLPLAYFNYAFPTPSAVTNYLTLSIDMGPQIYLGNFDPATMQVEAFGTFTSPKWATGILLTNNSAAANSNVYSCTIPDGNYSGGFEQFKFVIINNGNNTYESGNNRSFYTPTNSGTLPLAYFNGISTYGATPITFQVDMTVPLASGAFNPANGDTVSATGTFQTNTWTPAAFPLSASPGNSNIYVGTYVDKNQPGVYEQFKYVIVSGDLSTTNWENANNRVFLLGSTAYTNPLVFWSNLNTNQVLLVPTTVTFTVDMANAVDIFGYPFDAGNDLVVINGDFLTPTWPSIWTDANLYCPNFSVNDYGPANGNGNPNLVLQSSDNRYFTGTFVIPAGHSHTISYKYGIYHDSSYFNTNCDNEAGTYLNHVRYVRAAGTYNFPTDKFGLQQTNAAAAAEALYGVAVGSPSGGHVPVSWLGFPGVHLQVSTNLASQVWRDLSGTDGVGTTNWPFGSGAGFFRLYPTPQ